MATQEKAEEPGLPPQWRQYGDAKLSMLYREVGEEKRRAERRVEAVRDLILERHPGDEEVSLGNGFRLRVGTVESTAFDEGAAREFLGKLGHLAEFLYTKTYRRVWVLEDK